MYRLVKRLSILAFALLLYAPFLSNNEMYVLCLEGNGQIAVEKQHYDGSNPFINNSRKSSSLPSPGNNKCDNTNHIILADISSAVKTYFDFYLEPFQFLQNVVQPPTEYVFKKHISFVPFSKDLPRTNQQITAIRSIVLLI